MADPIRAHRVKAFSDWLETLPPETAWPSEEAFRFFRDITGNEMEAAIRQTMRRAAPSPVAAPMPRMVPDAIRHLKATVDSLPRGHAFVSADALAVALSYLDYLERRLDIVPTPGPEAA